MRVLSDQLIDRLVKRSSGGGRVVKCFGIVRSLVLRSGECRQPQGRAVDDWTNRQESFVLIYVYIMCEVTYPRGGDSDRFCVEEDLSGDPKSKDRK